MDLARAESLLAWFDASGRDLPWRHTRDPWAVLVSEVMLTQTQVNRVVPRFEAFLERFPDARTCAAASVGEVVTWWSGLGYNRRALALHRAATQVTEGHGGIVPDDLDALRSLPGVGAYTARAVLAFAYERDVGVVDTNAARVLARWEGRSLSRAEVQRIADDQVPPGTGWSWNQAMLDLGATICTARAPGCAECPVRGTCGWAGAGLPDPDPSVGTAGTSSRQHRFEGSDRQGRGRLVEALRRAPAPVRADHLAEVMGWPDDPDRAARVAEGLVTDGLAVRVDGSYRLP